MSDCWIQTHSGRRFDLLDPKPEDVDIDDIAWHLAAICRYTGATAEFYNVAQHSVLVSDLCFERAEPKEKRAAALAGLLHDAAEAYVGDASAPLKRAMRERGGGTYDGLELMAQNAVSQRYGAMSIGMAYADMVKEADLDMLAQEKRDLMGPSPARWGIDGRPCPFPGILRPWPRDYSRGVFVRRFHELTNGEFRRDGMRYGS